MIKLWKHVLLPLYRAIDAKTVLEIGAEYGTSTNILLKYVIKHGGHLHCIDPYPAFEAEQFAYQNKNHLTFYKDLSLNVIQDIPPVDVAMVDGDHNWFTVFNELKQLELSHGESPLKQPLILAHDLSWPYGRRDLYYNPDTIPMEFRQPFAQKGILPNRKELVEEGGMNSHLWNALEEGGERNGVLTGVEDFIKQARFKWHFLHLPLYYGLGILVTEAKLKANPKLKAQIDRFRLTGGALALVQQVEHLRCTDGVMMQVIAKKLYAEQERAAALEAELASVRKELNRD